MSDWWPGLSWSHAAFVFCMLYAAGALVYLFYTSRPKRLPRPHSSTRRNGTQAVP